MSTQKEYLQSEREKEWRVELRKRTATKDRLNIIRTQMPQMDPFERIKYQDREVNMGLTENQALMEASRCLDCPNPTCIDGCPVSINIPKFIKYIELGSFLEAAKTLKVTSALPAVCGRVCPQEKQCEAFILRS
jgi:glutamate synthase (NADPH/NADH) small chain